MTTGRDEEVRRDGSIRRVADGIQVFLDGTHFGVRVQDGVLIIHSWPADRLVVSRSQYKDGRTLKIRRVYG